MRDNARRYEKKGLLARDFIVPTGELFSQKSTDFDPFVQARIVSGYLLVSVSHNSHATKALADPFRELLENNLRTCPGSRCCWCVKSLALLSSFGGTNQECVNGDPMCAPIDDVCRPERD